MRDEADGELRVLIIDDSTLARKSMSNALRSEGFVVFELPSPIGASRELLRKNIGFVVIDIEMPALRGDKLAALFKSSPRFEDLSLVLVSSLPEAELRRLAREAGADAAIPKADLPGALIAKLKELATQRT